MKSNTEIVKEIDTDLLHKIVILLASDPNYQEVREIVIGELVARNPSDQDIVSDALHAELEF